jgi:tetratricopeptide (TPR) repeat protein
MSDVLLRQIEMLRLIPQHRSITAQKIRDQLAGLGFETTERTIQRDLNELSRRFPLVCQDAERPFKWHWAESAEKIDLPKIESEIRSGNPVAPVQEKTRSALKIFLSYGHDKNSRLVERIKNDLEKAENGGHECWFDTSGIKAGDDWRHAITSGIQNSNWVLSFISRHACREWDANGQRKQGVCLDELAIAIGTRGGIVKTILVESPTDPDSLSPPLTVSHIQYLDMHEWNEKEAEGNEYFEAWYSNKFAEILRVLNDPANQEFSGDIEFLREKLQPLDNAARIGELMANDFVGREWLRDEIVQWLNHAPQQKVFCLTGEPGFGKSAVAAWLAYQNRPEVIAAHFCQYNQPNFCDPGRVIRSLAFQIATRLPDFRLHLTNAIRTIESQPSDDDLNSLNKLMPAELFQSLIADAANMSIDGGRHRHLVIIDALDEAGKELVEFLAQSQSKLPSWLALFVTSRPNDAGVRQHLNMLNPHFRDVSDTRNQADAKAWILNWLGSIHVEDKQQSDILEPLLSKSEGNFHYLRTFRQMVEQDLSLLNRPQDYPQGLDSLYLIFFERQFKDIEAYRQWQAPFLRLVAAARRTLPLNLARRALRLGKEDWSRKVVSPLGSLFKVGGDKDAETIEPFHKSVRDWLKDDTRSGDFYVDEEAGHLALAKTIWNDVIRDENIQKVQSYEVLELPYHLTKLANGLLNNIVNSEEFWAECRPRFSDLMDSIDEIIFDFSGNYDVSEISDASISRAYYKEIKLQLDKMYFGKSSIEYAQSLCDNADILNNHEQVFKIIKAIYGENSLEFAEKSEEFVELFSKTMSMRSLDAASDEFLEAVDLSKQAINIREHLFGQDSEEVALSLDILGNLMLQNKVFEKADAALNRALAIREKLFSRNSEEVARTLINLGKSNAQNGNIIEAEKTLERALSIAEELYGTDSPALSEKIDCLADFYFDSCQFNRARSLYLRNLSIHQNCSGANSDATDFTLDEKIAKTYFSENNYAEAEKHFRNALISAKSTWGDHSNLMESNLSDLALVLFRQGHTEEALTIYGQALEICTRINGEQFCSDVYMEHEIAVYLRECEGRRN